MPKYTFEKLMIPIFGKTLDELKSIVTAEGLPPFTATQLAEWLYRHNAVTFDEMTNLSKKARELLATKYEVGLTKPERVSESADGTKKYLFPIANNRFIEAAYIPDSDRATLCVSSQSGCKMGCLFCMTAKQGFQGNLSAGEILNQLRSIPEYQQVTNIVYMGMGEPLDNLDNVLKSLETLTSKWGMGWSAKRITVSTIGLIPALRQFLEKSNCHLAISLHTPFDEERRMLMPIQNVYPISEVVAELRKYKFSDHHRLSFEYIMFDGLNDTPRHVKGLARLLNGLTCRINLIRFHPIPDSPLRTSPDERMVQFRDSLTAKGIYTTIRASRGQDIQAACGLLSTKAMQERNNQQR